MARRRRQEELERVVVRFFDQQQRHVYKESELNGLLDEHADEWKVPMRHRSVPKFTALMSEMGLKTVTLESEHLRNATRYVWKEPRIYELALSLGKRPYFSHASAMFLRGLTDQIPKTIYINDEQSPKNFGTPSLTQQSIDRAFGGKQRTTRAIYTYATSKIVVISGKSTGRLEVSRLEAPDSSVVEATKIERTLIDAAVRPNYAGGPVQVLAAYRAARDRMSVSVLVSTLTKLEYAYPYHQVIGFYMRRAGYEESQLKALKRMEQRFKFYLTYDLKDPDFDSEWQLYIPKGF